MVVLTLNPGESVLAVNQSSQAAMEFELVFYGYDFDEYPKFELRVAKERAFVFGMQGGALTCRHVSHLEPEVFEVKVGGYVRVGDTVVKIGTRSRNRVKLAIEAPQFIRFKRPAQHGSSLLAS